MYDHVLVGTDGSDTATRAVEAAALLAHTHDARLTIVHAFNERKSVPAPEAVSIPVELSWRFTVGGAAEALVLAAADRAQSVAGGGLIIDTRAEPGQPMPVLLALARELEPDAVVVGNADVHRARVRRSIGHALSRKAIGDIVIVDTVNAAVRMRSRSDNAA